MIHFRTDPQILSAHFLLLAGIALFCAGCSDQKQTANSSPATTGESGGTEQQGADRNEKEGTIPGGPFLEYWYGGVAELNRYELEQARYGEVRKGDAVLIFVTEDFLAEKQVKADKKVDRLTPSVLKANITRKFITGIYPYSMMTSVFTPVDIETWPHSLKVTTSSQEWCGHTFLQLNREEEGYHLRAFSYFEQEGDQDRVVTPDLLEDEIWTRLRINPESLPLGRVHILPGTLVTRLRHTPIDPVDAEARRVELPNDADGEAMERYIVTYSDPPRTLMIDYRKNFPHEIMGWTDQYNDFGKILETKATRTHVLRIPYWSKNRSADTLLRKELGLSANSD